ncbi:hypothetical protein SODG_005836 [Sodalis praecaptivus]
MANYVAIQNTAMPVVEYQGKRVVTFAMINKAHGRPKGTACAAFNRNRRRFVEGRDFFNVTSYVKRMRSLEGYSPLVPPKGSSSQSSAI